MSGGALESFMLDPEIFDSIDRVTGSLPGMSRAPRRATLADSLVAAEQIQATEKVGGKETWVRWQPIKDLSSTASIDTALDRLASAMASFGPEMSAAFDAPLGREAIECAVVAADSVGEIHLQRNPALGRLLGHGSEAHF